MSRILVTGSNGFIGRNLVVRLGERADTVIAIGSDASDADLTQAARDAEFVIHLAGVNRPSDPSHFATGNLGSTERLCTALAAAGSAAPILYASSTQAEADNPYGASKRAAEEALLAHGNANRAPIYLYRLTNVFGKWARPDYNSAVATFCRNAATGQAITVHDPAAALNLVYIDDVIDDWLATIDAPPLESGFRDVFPVYRTTVGDVAAIIDWFPAARATMITPPVGVGLVRALFSTYLSHLPPGDFAYRVPVHSDPRGDFVELLKTRDSGQFSYFTAHPGVTRGDHYHHSKAEKFLVISGTAHFGFRQVVTGETHGIVVKGGAGEVVDTIPGWTHNITNIGEDLMVVMLWANEIFDRARPDTIAMKV